LSIAFRNQTAYERYTEGRRLWNQLQLAVRNMGRIIWLQVCYSRSLLTQIPHGKETEARDILEKRSAINLLLAYAIALKHHLREERGTYYDDLYPLVSHLPRLHSSLSGDGRPPPSPSDKHQRRKQSVSPFSMLAQATFANSLSPSDESFSSLFNHDRKDLACQGTLVQGNLPLEIANFLTNFSEHCQSDGRLPVPLYNAMQAGINGLVDVLTNCERILRTPIPLAYNIAISQTGTPSDIQTNRSLGICHSSSFPVGATLSVGYNSSKYGISIYPIRSPPYFLRNRKPIRL
jgi:ion channel-forming bestrophin family protein